MSQTFSTDEAKTDHLLKILPKKGRSALKRFVKCLRESSTEGTAHDELADFIESNAVELKNNQMSSNDTEPVSEINQGAVKGNKTRLYYYMITRKGYALYSISGAIIMVRLQS